MTPILVCVLSLLLGTALGCRPGGLPPQPAAKPAAPTPTEPGHGEPTAMKTEQDWPGYVRELDLLWQGLRTLGEPTESTSGVYVISDLDSWRALWATWLNGQAPEVSFQDSVVLLATVQGVNRIDWSAESSAGSDLHVFARTTRRGGPGFSFLLSEIRRGSWTRINGQALSGGED